MQTILQAIMQIILQAVMQIIMQTIMENKLILTIQLLIVNLLRYL